MKRILFLLLAILTAGCGTTLYNPQNGQRLAVMRSDMVNVTYTGGGVTFHADKMSNSVPTRAALLGANKIVGTVVSGAIGLSVPGSGVTPLIGKAAISAVPAFSSPIAKPGD